MSCVDFYKKGDFEKAFLLKFVVFLDIHNKVKKLTGYDMKVFRPPYGDYNDVLIESAEKCGYHAIQWDVDSLDWKNYGVDSKFGLMSAVIMGSTETTFYTIAVYSASVGIKKTRFVLFASLVADFVGIFVSVLVCNVI